jgi:hypothetical protein
MTRAAKRIAKAEEGLAETQTVLDHAKRAVEAADRAEGAAHSLPNTLVRSRKRSRSSPAPGRAWR